MENSNTQLPAEWKQKIENEAEYKASLQFHKKYSHDQWTACVITYRQGATEYAIKLLQCDKANSALEEKNRGLVENNAAARALLEKVISRHEAGLLPDRFIYNEIKTFLDGK